jgi:hypothetical protein
VNKSIRLTLKFIIFSHQKQILKRELYIHPKKTCEKLRRDAENSGGCEDNHDLVKFGRLLRQSLVYSSVKGIISKI